MDTVLILIIRFGGEKQQNQVGIKMRPKQSGIHIPSVVSSMNLGCARVNQFVRVVLLSHLQTVTDLLQVCWKRH
jgi:hypothetical protein